MNALSDNLPFSPLEAVTIGTRLFQPRKLPPMLEFREDMGLIAPRVLAGHGQWINAGTKSGQFAVSPRCEVMPNGDLLCMFPAVAVSDARRSGKRMVAYRSRDRGFTWDGPRYAWDSPGPDHEFIPLCPKGSNAVYAFGTQPRSDVRAPGNANLENFALGWRVSTNNGHSWSTSHLILPINDRTYRGMASMRMCETESGTWLLGAQTLSGGSAEKRGNSRGDGNAKRSPGNSLLHVLRSEDRGKTWQLLPGQEGWPCSEDDPWEEGRVISLGGSRVLLFAKSRKGTIWETRSDDDGRTWSAPIATSIPLPASAPLIFHLSDGKTLIALHHNAAHVDRSQLWCSVSRDEAKTWSEPRFLLASAAKGENGSLQRSDLLVHGSRIHLVLDHQGQQIVHFSFAESDLDRLPAVGDFLRY